MLCLRIIHFYSYPVKQYYQLLLPFCWNRLLIFFFTFPTFILIYHAVFFAHAYFLMQSLSISLFPYVFEYQTLCHYTYVFTSSVCFWIIRFYASNPISNFTCYQFRPSIFQVLSPSFQFKEQLSHKIKLLLKVTILNLYEWKMLKCVYPGHCLEFRLQKHIRVKKIKFYLLMTNTQHNNPNKHISF